MQRFALSLSVLSMTVFVLSASQQLPSAAAQDVSFAQQVRPILSNKCFVCHGPDEEKLEAGLRLDDPQISTRPLASGETAVVAGHPEKSELIRRISSKDPDVRMPPAGFAKQLTDAEIDTLRRWIEQGGQYATHWAWAKPVRPAVPAPAESDAHWPLNPIDNFVLQKMTQHGFRPSIAADRIALARRVFLDLTGLPPTIAEVDAFAQSSDPLAYEKLVDDLLARPAFGEHWARQWLDLARYADSAGYADDPSRTIWAYRDWVIRAYNNNMPFDQFTVEQIAGDLMPSPTPDQLIATAFHRNTLTNNEGGTNDEEFRNVAVVDRVNTTMAVWMGTTIACAQCHSHKYDPITQEEYFKVFAILNNTQDADRRDESPVLEILTEDQLTKKAGLESEIAELRKALDTPTDALTQSQKSWEAGLRSAPRWTSLLPISATRSSAAEITIRTDGDVFVPTTAETDQYTLELGLNPDAKDNNATAEANQSIAAIRLETLPDAALPGQGAGHAGGNFVITQIRAQLIPAGNTSPAARFLRIEIPGQKKILSLAEVQVFSGGKNLASGGKATQSSTDFSGPPELAIDGNTDGQYENKSVTHTSISDDPWWEIDLGSQQPIEKLVLWNRIGDNIHERLSNFRLSLLDEQRQPVFSQNVEAAPNPSAEFVPSGVRNLVFAAALADYNQNGFVGEAVIDGKADGSTGWAVGGAVTEPHSLILVPQQPISPGAGATLRIVLEQNSKHANHLLGHFRLSATGDSSAVGRSQLPKLLADVLDLPDDQRNETQRSDLARYYREQVAPELSEQRNRLSVAQKQLSDIKPASSVPILREMADNRRVTHLQFRGNYLDRGPEVSEGVPAVFHPLPKDRPADRLALAMWLVDRENALTARVLVNRYWESLFGRGLVLTSEEFGSQGELPTHPDLLDWLAVDVMEQGWNRKALLKQIVTSATYRQSARVSPELIAADADNRWLARGPRVRMSAETVRDQALSVSGLLSDRMYGAPVNPPQPNLGLTAAFGSSTDWKTSSGEDRYRRAIYTTWRRSNPYPSMATFDAPNREVCTVRRSRTNTPLQSLVTLNDPAYVEAAQALGRLMLTHPGSLHDQLTHGFRRCLLRLPTAEESAALRALFDESRAELAGQPDEAMKLATDPLGPLPKELAPADAAAMTVVSNVLLNLDEIVLKP